MTTRIGPWTSAAALVIGVFLGGSFGRAEDTPVEGPTFFGKTKNTPVEKPNHFPKITVGAPVYDLAFSPRGDFLATTGKNGVRLWQAGTRLEAAKLERGAIPRPENGWFMSDRYFDNPVFSLDGKLLAAAEYFFSWKEGERSSAWGRYRVWNVASGKLQTQRRFEYPLASLAFSPDGTRLAVGDSANGFGAYKIAGEETWYVPGKSPMAPSVRDVAFSPDGKLLAVADDPEEGRAYMSGGVHVPAPGGDGTIRLIDLTTKKTLHKISEKSSQGLHRIAFAPGGKTLHAVYEDGRLRAWEVGTGRLLKSYPVHSEPWYFTPIAFSCDGKWLAIRDGRKGPVLLWDPAAHRKAGAIDFSTYPTGILAITSSGLLLAVADVNDEKGVVSLCRRKERASE